MASAIAYTFVIWIVASFIGIFFRGSAQLAVYVIGTVLTFLVARGGYRFDGMSWLLLLLGPIGTFVLLWRRGNRRQSIGQPTA